MKALMSKAARVIAGAVVFVIACTVAGLGLTVFAMLALFALGMAGLGLIAAPFLSLLQHDDPSDAEPAAAGPKTQPA